MEINKVTPWEGELVWVGEVHDGTSSNGNPWKAADFALKYADADLKERYICFSLFGADKVDRLLATPIGTVLRVLWRPEAMRSKNGKWFSKLSAIKVSYANAKQAQQQSQSMPTSQGTPVAPPNFPPYQPQLGIAEDMDMPF